MFVTAYLRRGNLYAKTLRKMENHQRTTYLRIGKTHLAYVKMAEQSDNLGVDSDFRRIQILRDAAQFQGSKLE